MEAEGTKEQQQESQQINGLEQQSESGDAQVEAQGESEAGKTEVAAGKKTKDENEPAGKASGAEEMLESETKEKAEEAGETNQAASEDRVAVGVSGAEPKEEAEVSGTPEEQQEEKGAKADALERNTSTSSAEGRTGSTSDEPLSPEPEEEEEFWPEFSPSSPEESPQSPTELKNVETGSPPSGPTAPEAATGNSTSTEAVPKGDQEQLPAAEGAAAAKEEKKKRPTFDRREMTRPRMPPRAHSRKAIMDKFGGAATGPAPNIKKTGGANTVKTMLLEWCRAKTRGYEHVDIQNFSTSWSSGMAFCALVHKFFPDAFDYAALDPANRKENFTLAFSTAEELADCAQLLDVADMVRMSVPDNKCIYTYVQELYRSLVQKGLVKTKKN
ncbi:smoothelin-like protein 1 [Zootoca vivipara]|uniref:smoothelin-like protein 1 n=1 Tax=Zootoca vivipara TaxID=8524 RepID=UPI0015906E26|nr:smoothelin-like protein 1 [Zootoca vivipara]XP_034980697.1 smoothelin-like protein 1 [Zootoca vivipara]XP_034980706.1 smoothelin-like protein 1 [Zootoca vivipara]